MNKRLIIPAVLAIGIGTWGYQRWQFGQTHESTDNAQIDGHIVPVVAKVGGYVTAVNVGENVHVTADSVLVTIDEREYKVKLAQADADLAAARATAGGRGIEGQAVTVVRTASSQRDVGSAQVLAARAQVRQIETRIARQSVAAPATGVVQDAGVPARPSISTRHSRQDPKASTESVAQSFGTETPASCAARMIDVPAGTVTSKPSMVSVTCSLERLAGVP